MNANSEQNESNDVVVVELPTVVVKITQVVTLA